MDRSKYNEWRLGFFFNCCILKTKWFWIFCVTFSHFHQRPLHCYSRRLLADKHPPAQNSLSSTLDIKASSNANTLNTCFHPVEEHNPPRPPSSWGLVCISVPRPLQPLHKGVCVCVQGPWCSHQWGGVFVHGGSFLKHNQWENSGHLDLLTLKTKTHAASLARFPSLCDASHCGSIRFSDVAH